MKVMKKGRLAVLALAILPGSIGVSAQEKIDTDKVNRAVATVMAANLDEVLTDLAGSKVPVNRSEVGRYVAEILSGKDLGISRLESNMYIDNIIRSNMPARPDTVTVESQQIFIDGAASQPGSMRMPSGLVFTVLTEGEGVNPGPNDKVKVNYVAKLSDGSVFDDTEGEAIEFDVPMVIPGFSEGLQMMKPGGTYRIVIPAELGYGTRGIPGIIPGNAALDFTVKLEGIVRE